MALARLGSVQTALVGQGRFFRTQLADELQAALGVSAAPVALMRGAAVLGDEGRVNRVNVVGVDDRFWRLGGGAAPISLQDGLALNNHLARRLNAKVGDDIVLRVDKPSLLSRDAPLSTVEDAQISLRLPIRAVLTDREFGRFSLEANQSAPLNVFLPLSTLQGRLGIEGRANTLLLGSEKPLQPDAATRTLWEKWQFDDSGLQLRTLTGPLHPKPQLELRTRSVFLDGPVAEAAMNSVPERQGVLTYFVNSLSVGGKSTPYSSVAAMEGPPLAADLKDDEALITQWLADDTGAKVGDTLRMSYWVVGAMRRLEEKTTNFKIRGILPMSPPALDPDLMPDIPGLSDKKDCRQWEPGVPIELNRIRDKDQKYWEQFRGAPKAFITLRRGRVIWNNRFGTLTSVRYPAQDPDARHKVEACIRQALSPGSLGLFFMPVRAQALAAGEQSFDLGQLFIGFSLFLILAALILSALLFGFGAEQRSAEIGTLLAVGWPPRMVRRLLLLEGSAIALSAAVVGAGAGILYTRLVVRALSTIWSGAVAGSSLQYHAEPATLAVGAAASFGVSLFTLWLVARRQGARAVREQLNGSIIVSLPRRARWHTAAALLCLLAALGTVFSAGAWQNAEAFFAAGFLLLLAGILGVRAAMSGLLAKAGSVRLDKASLAARNTLRRASRSLSAVGLLACGAFLVVAVGAGHKDLSAGAEKRSSGTGGFAFYAETALPIYEDLNSERGLDLYALDRQDIPGTEFVPLRVKEGDEASCLNLNRAQSPRLYGVNPAAMADRKAFTFAAAVRPNLQSHQAWQLLNEPLPNGEIPVIGDANTVTWSLGSSVGRTIDTMDDRGRPRRLRVVGALANSVLQGGLLMSEDNFVQLFPARAGYQAFLIDAPAGAAREAVARSLRRGLSDAGIDLVSTVDRLKAFGEVEQTYLSIFATLGALGLLLGSAGLGVIVLRNVLERRRELAALRAVGFSRGMLRSLVFREHLLLLLAGLGVGTLAAVVSIIPAMRMPGGESPLVPLALLLAALLLSGIVWVWAAASAALHGSLQAALQQE
jgi:ABC-type antimicrobial peptide transport system permease subunit